MARLRQADVDCVALRRARADGLRPPALSWQPADVGPSDVRAIMGE